MAGIRLLPSATLPSGLSRSSRDRTAACSSAGPRIGVGPATAHQRSRADPHDGGTLRDRGLEIAAHPHRADSASPSRRPAHGARRSRAGRRRPAGHRHQALHVEAQSAAARSTSAAGPRARNHPFAASPAQIDLDEHRGRPGARRAILRPSSARSTECQQATQRRQRRAPCCAEPARRSANGGRRGPLGERPRALATSSWARFSPRSVRPASSAAPTRVEPTSLGRRTTSVTASGSRPAAASRPSRDRVPAPRPERSAITGRSRLRPRRRPGARSRCRAGTRSGPPDSNVQTPRVGDLVDARASSSEPDCGGQVERGRPSAVVPATSSPNRATSGARSAGAELVVAARRCTDRARRAPGRVRARAPRATPASTTPAASPRHPACIAADRVVVREHDRRAVGRRRRERQPRDGGHDPVRVEAPAGAAGRPRSTSVPCTVERRTQRRGIGERRGVAPSRPVALGRPTHGIVIDVIGEVHRSYGPMRRTAVPIGEADPRRPSVSATTRAGFGQRRNSGTSKSSSPRSSVVRRRASDPRRSARAELAGRARRARVSPSKRSKPAAITVMRTSSPSASSIDRAEDDVRVGVRGLGDDLGRLVDLEQPEVATGRRC